MANTFLKIYIHIVFSVKNRLNLISKTHKDELAKYITGIISNKNQKLLSINCMPDHTHILISINSDVKISDLVRDIKSNSTKFINDNNWIVGKFSWQEGYGAFSYSECQIDIVCKYIINQEEHHKKKSFKEEYIELLEKFKIQFEEKYLFDWIE
jgi:REP element-mobilizing transposase RayT